MKKTSQRWIVTSGHDVKIMAPAARRTCHRARRARSTIACLIGAMSILSASGGSIFAEETPTITVSKGDRINLTLTPLSGSEGAAATKTLQHDLELAGYFTMSANASYNAKGNASGGSL